MITIKEVLFKSIEHLEQKGISGARRQGEELISDALRLSRIQLYMLYDRPLNEEELNRCRASLMRRAAGEPCQYIRGKVDFLSCEMMVNPAVLIPRQETEILADKIIQSLPQEEFILWDICTGSGCLGIAIKKNRPLLKVTLSDVSVEALEVAKKNAAANDVDVAYLHGDFLEPFAGCKAHVVVCNPPYIREDEFQALAREVRDYEPKKALISGATGLEFYERLANELPDYLFPGAVLWCEIGAGQGQTVKDLFSTQSWKDPFYEADWSGNDRFFRVSLA